MRIVNTILSRIVGCVFVFSALTKAITLQGFGQTVDGFVSLLGMDMLYGHGIVVGVALCILELLFGAMMFHKATRRIAICGITALLLFFTSITYINLTSFYGGIESCGCFGEVIHLNAAQTFYKNIILLAVALWLFISHMRKNSIKPLTYIVLCDLLCSCAESHHATYIIDFQQKDSIQSSLLTWDIMGSLSAEEDSIAGNRILVSPSFRDSVAKQLPSDSIHYKGVYSAQYGMMDFREVYGIAPEDTTGTLQDRVSYAYCHILVPSDTTLYLRMECAMPYTLWSNGISRQRKDISGLDIFPLPLKEGENELIARFETNGDDLSFEATLCDSMTVGHLFADGQSGNIVYALVNESKDVLLTNAHQNVLDAPVTIQVHDVHGDLLKEFALQKDTFIYPVHEMEWGKSYMFSMTMAGRTVRQPVLCGKDDDALIHYQTMLDSLPISHPRRDEIVEVLFRLDFLLHHPSRYEGDWWWQFKIPAVTYQLEHAFAHLNECYGAENTEPNIMFVSYRSALDDSLQHYLLARPNYISSTESLPLVVVMRPNIQNPYHFFSCPQLARQWAVNQMQAMAERYRCLILMPEMRTYLDEDITPKAEREFHLALQHARNHYPVDSTRIYLHANCTGGYRALKLATMNPGLFRAIGLYAPVYYCPYDAQWSKDSAPEHDIRKLKGTPMFIHGDPLDTHSPYSTYKDLVDDCKRNGIPLTLSLKRNSGKAYNVVLVGIEAMEFMLTKEIIGGRNVIYKRH